MANVIFKRGLQQNVPTNGHAEDGVFYLTTDTNRLYIGQGTDRKLLNQTIQIIPNINELNNLSASWTTDAQRAAHINDFYYVTGTGSSSDNGYNNILVVWTRNLSDTGYEWRQINPDHDTILDVNAGGISGDVTGNVATISMSVADTTGRTVSGDMTLTATNGLVLSDDNNGNLTISGDTYTLGKSVNVNNTQATISLSSTNNATANSDVKLIAGSGNVSFNNGANGIELSVVDTHVAAVSMSVGTGSLTTTVSDLVGNAPSDTLENVGVIVGSSSDHYLPINSTVGKTAGTVYTKDEVDSILRGLDGMTYKGTLGIINRGADIEVLPTTQVKNGDTYVIREDGLTSSSSQFVGATFNQATADQMANGTKIGDMLIAKGAEDTATGFIGNNLTWTYIPAGNDSLADVTYHGEAEANDNSLSLKNIGGTSVAKIALTQGTDITITSDTSNSAILNATIAHRTITTSTTAAAVASLGTSSFTAIKELTVSNGHVTAITTDTFTPIDYSLAGPTGANGGRFNVNSNTGTNDSTVSFALYDGTNLTNKSTINLPFNSSSIKLTSNTATGALTMDFEWGTF